MRIQHFGTVTRLWLSARDTAEWARRPGAAWPCSQLAGRRLFAEWDGNDLIDVSVDGGRGDQEIGCNEFTAITDDFRGLSRAQSQEAGR